MVASTQSYSRPKLNKAAGARRPRKVWNNQSDERAGRACQRAPDVSSERAECKIRKRIRNKVIESADGRPARTPCVDRARCSGDGRSAPPKNDGEARRSAEAHTSQTIHKLTCAPHTRETRCVSLDPRLHAHDIVHDRVRTVVRGFTRDRG